MVVEDSERGGAAQLERGSFRVLEVVGSGEQLGEEGGAVGYEIVEDGMALAGITDAGPAARGSSMSRAR